MAAKIHELRHKRDQARLALQGLMDKNLEAARAGNRGFNDGERREQQRLEAELHRLEAEVLDEERDIEQGKREAAGAFRVSPGAAWPRTEDEPGPAVSALPALPARTVHAIARLFAGLVGETDPVAIQNSFRGVVAAALGGMPLHPAIVASTATEGIPEDGGFAVAPEVARGIFVRAIEQSVWLRIGARLEPMVSSEKVVTAIADDDETSDAEAGLKAGWSGEGASATGQLMKLRQVKLEAKKLVVLATPSNELAEDSMDYLPTLEAALTRAIAKKFDRAVLEGTGGGQPLGLLNAPATITVSKEASQAADSVVWQNVVKMWSRLPAGSHELSYWLAHPTTLPMLLQMYMAVGVSGTTPRGAVEPDGRGGYILLGRPLVITSRVKPVGDKGDVILVDPTQVAIGIRRGIAIERSEHALFGSDQLAVRGKFRGDAKPLWEKSRTLADGSSTVSPYLVLEAR